jgi:hypothetical protein
MQSDPKMNHPSTDAAIAKRRTKIISLSSGDKMPLEAMYVIRVWAEDIKTLNARCAAVRAAISVSAGAKHHEVTLDTQAKSLFHATYPGFTHSDSKKWGLYAQNDYLADLLPLLASFTGKSEPEALYLGANDNIAGIRLFTAGTPHHAFVVGVTRSGKSVLMIDLLTQTDPYFGFTAIIEEGLSYGTYVQAVGGEPIIISADSPYVFNMFDTQSLPLTGDHVSATVALLLKMVGSSGLADVDRNRAAMLAEYANRLYDDFAGDWRQRNHSCAEEVFRDALATYEWFKTKMPMGSEYLEAFIVCRELKAENPAEWSAWRAQFEAARVNAFAQNPSTERLCRDYLFSVFVPEDFPQLSHLVEALKYEPLQTHDAKETAKLATHLAGWTADQGSFGGFFDGVSNFATSSKIVHFELGMIGKGADALKECVGFLISHWVRQHVVSMPRNIRKRVIFEEIARFFDVPDGEKIIAEFAAQLGKYACWLCSITQVYAQIKDMPIKGKLIGNSSLFFILKQKDPEDLQDLANSIGIPDSAQQAILNYVIPANQPAKTRASQFTVLAEGENGLMCGSLRCVTTAPLIYAASSTGEEFEARRQELAKYPTILEGIWEETHKKQLLSQTK